MLIPIIYPSAGEFWLHSDPLLTGEPLYSRDSLPSSFSQYYGMNLHAADEVAEMLHLKQPLICVCARPQFRRENMRYICKMQKRPFPPGSFVFLQRHEYEIYIACPELCFVQAAQHLQFIELIRFGTDLCAVYYIDEHSAFHQSGREQITSAGNIRAYLKEADGLRGITKARKAVRYILDSSNSPMETALAVIMVLPISRGGFGLPAPALNDMVILRPSAARLLRIGSIHGDFVWRKERVVVEYNSNLAHLSPTAYSHDMNRNNAYLNSGYVPLTMTAENVKDLDSLESFMRLLRRELHMRNADRELAKHRERRQGVFKILFH